MGKRKKDEIIGMRLVNGAEHWRQSLHRSRWGWIVAVAVLVGVGLWIYGRSR